MSKYSDFIKEVKKNDKKFFYGEGFHQRSNKYFEFKHYHNDDEIIIITMNVKIIKGNYALLIGNNKAVFLKEWQVRKIRNWNEGVEGFAVKLNRNYFKIYTFKSDFEEFCFSRMDTFDDLVEIAKQQDKVNMQIAEGWAYE